MAGRWMNPISEHVPPGRAELVRALRAMPTAGPLRPIADGCCKSVATVSRIFAGQTLPDNQTLRTITVICGGDWEEIEVLWLAAMAESRRDGAAGYLVRRVAQVEQELRRQAAQIGELQRILEQRST